MIYITSDPHGRYTHLTDFLLSGEISKNDVLIMLGDTGFNYDAVPGSGVRRKAPMNWYNIPILCVQGNHELRPHHMESYKEVSWNGGIVYREDKYPNLLFAKDGEIYTIDGQDILICGGAYSVFKDYRIAHGLSWYPDEQPSEETKARVEQQLADRDWKIDMVLTHTCPTKAVPKEKYIRTVDQSTVDTSTEDWLDSIEDRLEYKKWYCGHWHIEKQVENIHFIYKGIHKVETPAQT